MKKKILITFLLVVSFGTTLVSLSFAEDPPIKLCMSCTQDFTCTGPPTINGCWVRYGGPGVLIYSKCGGGTDPSPAFKVCTMPPKQYGCIEITPQKSIQCTGCKDYTSLTYCLMQTNGTANNSGKVTPCTPGP